MIEVKSLTLAKNRVAFFPDSPTKREVKHLNDLTRAMKKFQSFLVFIIKRSDVDAFKLNNQIDPLFSNKLTEAISREVQVCAVKCFYDPISTKELNILNEVPLTRNT
ncbi:MAG: DNA/RNA nuclease SfsA [Promethearchaeota archaeon]